MAKAKKRPRYKTVGGRKMVRRKGYVTRSGKRVAAKYVPLAGAALKMAKKSGKVKSRRVKSRRAKSRRRNPLVARVSVGRIKIAQTRKTAPKGWKSSMGPYVITTLKGTKVKAFRDLEAAKKALAMLRSGGRKGLKLVKVAASAKTSSKKVSSKRRKVSSKRRKNTSRRRVSRRRKTSSKRRNPRRRVVRRRRNAKSVTRRKVSSFLKRLGLK